MSNQTLLATKTAKLASQLGWERLQGLSTKEVIAEIETTFGRLAKTPVVTAILNEVQTLKAMAQKYA